MPSHILHVISKSHPLWQVHAASTCKCRILHVIWEIPPSLASTCQVTSYTSYQNPTLSGKYMQVSHLTRHIRIPPSLASTCPGTSYTSYQKNQPLWQVHAKKHLTRHIRNPTLSGKYMPSHILHVISKTHPLWQVHAKSHLTRHIKNPTLSGKHMPSHISHVISKSQPLWQVHATSHLTRHINNPILSGKYMLVLHLRRHIKIPPSLASTCQVTSYTSYQKSHPLWQVHASVTSYTSYQNPTLSGKYMPSQILHIISISRIPPSLASTCQVTYYTSYQKSHPLSSLASTCGCHILHVISKIPASLASTCECHIFEGSLEVKLPTIWTDEKQRWKGSERRERLEERRVEEKESEERRCRCAKKVGKSRNTVFFQWFVAQEGRKVGSLTLGVRTTFGGWDVEKVHAPL